MSRDFRQHDESKGVVDLNEIGAYRFSMYVRKSVVCFVFSILSAACVGHAQEARIETTQAEITAGDRLEGNVTLHDPTGCPTYVNLYFHDLKTGEQFSLSGQTDGKKTEVPVMSSVPKDLSAGEYKSFIAELNPCPGYSKSTQLKVTETTVTVKPFPNPIQLPASAEVKLTLTQTQFLQTEMTKLSGLRGQLDTVVNQNSNASQLQSLLLKILDEAEDDLTATEEQYRKRILHSQDGSLPIFFADFHVQYQALRGHLKALVPSGHASNSSSAKLVYVQLRQRPSGGETPSGSPDVDKLRHLIRDNEKAYSIVKDTGQPKFHARLSSYPMGARITYKNALDSQYMDYSSPTNVSWATFDLAYWDFKFHKDDCPDDQFRRINPYEENDPADISVEFHRCKSR